MNDYPSYASWSIGQSTPGPYLCEFIDWVRKHYSWQNDKWTRRSEPLIVPNTNLPEPRTRTSKLSALKKDPLGPCKGGCPKQSISRAGSTAGYIRETCFTWNYTKQTFKARLIIKITTYTRQTIYVIRTS